MVRFHTGVLEAVDCLSFEGEVAVDVNVDFVGEATRPVVTFEFKNAADDVSYWMTNQRCIGVDLCPHWVG